MSMAHHAHEPILDMNAPQGIPCDVTGAQPPLFGTLGQTVTAGVDIILVPAAWAATVLASAFDAVVDAESGAATFLASAFLTAVDAESWAATVLALAFDAVVDAES